MTNSADRYDAFTRSVHWLMALMIFGLIGVGMYMTDLPREDALRPQLYMLHKSFGVLVLCLGVIRIAWALMTRHPELPHSLRPWEIGLTRIVKFGMYLLMLATPLVGYAMSNFGDKAVSLFGTIDMPTLFAPDHDKHEITEELHEILAFTLLGFVGLHILGTLKHRFLDSSKTDVLKRML